MKSGWKMPLPGWNGSFRSLSVFCPPGELNGSEMPRQRYYQLNGILSPSRSPVIYRTHFRPNRGSSSHSYVRLLLTPSSLSYFSPPVFFISLQISYDRYKLFISHDYTFHSLSCWTEITGIVEEGEKDNQRFAEKIFPDN